MSTTAEADAVSVASLPTPYYQDDAVTIYHGDCREVLPQLPKHDLLLTDPPYGIGFAAQPTKCQRANGMVKKSWDSNAPKDQVAAAVNLHRDAVVWGGNYFSLPVSRGWLIWCKTGNAPSMADAEMAWTSCDMNTRVFNKSVKSASLEKCLRGGGHPTQKPVGLMQWCISFFPDATTILDPFAGSGTTGVAAKLEGRKATLIEMEERYCEIAANRLSQGVLF